MVCPDTPHYRGAVAKGNTLKHGSVCMHWQEKKSFYQRWRGEGVRVLGVELADDATRLGDLLPARERTIVVLGHEHQGIPAEAYPWLDDVVEIPMIGTGSSLNVAVAGSLVLYKLSGLI